MKVNHYEGDPYGCSDDCSRNNTHKGEVPANFACEGCGGSNSACFAAFEENERCPYEYGTYSDDYSEPFPF